MGHRFDIGHLVVYQAALEEYRRWPNVLPRIMQIVERLTQECPAGYQFHYKLAGVEGWHIDDGLAPLSALDEVIREVKEAEKLEWRALARPKERKEKE